MGHAEIGRRLALATCLVALAFSFLPAAASVGAQAGFGGQPETVTPASALVDPSSERDSYNDWGPGTGSKPTGGAQGPGIIVDPTELWIGEPDGTRTFNIRLATEPGHTVTILLTPSNDQCNLSRNKVVLQKGNWDRGVDTEVTASLGAAVDGEQICIVQTGPAVSADPVYNGRASDNVTVFAREIVQAGITIEPTSLEISEPAGSAMFAISLTVQPQLSVTIPVIPSNNQCTVTPAVALLNAQNWSDGAPITVTAVDDGQVDGDQVCVVKTGPPSGGDPRFEGLTGNDVIVTVLDTDIPQPKIWSIYLPLVSLGWPPIPDIPVLQPIDNLDGDGDYSITWTRAPGAETYALEEADNRAFNSPKVVYSGPATSFAAFGQTTGRFHYRVKARNGWGDSAWSEPQLADILWELEPNDRASEANGALVSGLTYRGRFPGKTDEFDYYYFDLSAIGPVELWLRDIPAGHDYNLVLRDANLMVVGYSAGRGSVPEHIAQNGLPPGRYYAQVWNYIWQEEGSTQPYELQVLY